MMTTPAWQPIFTFDADALRNVLHEVVEEVFDERGVARQPDLTFLTMAEAVEVSGVSRGTLNNAINAGELPASKRGRGWRIQAAALETWMKANPIWQDRPAKVRQTGFHHLKP